jgi:hypothetical protein
VRDPDEVYLGIEIHAANDGFAGTAQIFAALDELLAFAGTIAGFPSGYEDRREYEFGSRDARSAGGFCSFAFRCLDQRGHIAVDVSLEDNTAVGRGMAQFSLETEPAAIDRFTESLRAVEKERHGSAVLLPIVHD